MIRACVNTRRERERIMERIRPPASRFSERKIEDDGEMGARERGSAAAMRENGGGGSSFGQSLCFFIHMKLRKRKRKRCAQHCPGVSMKTLKIT